MFHPRISFFIVAAGLSIQTSAAEESTPGIDARFAALEQQNALLLQMVQAQQQELRELRDRLESVDTETRHQSDILDELQDTGISAPTLPTPASIGNSVHISGEAGFAFHAGEANTIFPNEEFRVDEARLFIEAEVAQGVYFFSELEFFTREENANGNIRAGELYLEVENIFKLPDWDRAVNFRAGRLDIPFGEEYRYRDVMENALISHSLADIWGIDEGFEFFGNISNFDYVLALQNGSINRLRDFTSDKSITARIGFEPTSQLRISGSGMRTGDIESNTEGLSEVWIGNAVFRSIGSTNTTEFDAELLQTDIRYDWSRGFLAGSFGKAWYDDNDPNDNNARELEFWSIEAQQGISDGLFAAIRYSEIEVEDGYPLPGMSDRRQFFLSPLLTEQLARLSLGITYWPYTNLVLKADYTFESGDHIDGSKRTDSNQFSAEAGIRF